MKTMKTKIPNIQDCLSYEMKKMGATEYERYKFYDDDKKKTVIMYLLYNGCLRCSGTMSEFRNSYKNSMLLNEN